MIAVDSNVIIDFLNAPGSPLREQFVALVQQNAAVIAPVTLTEIVSDPKAGVALRTIIEQLTVLPIAEGYWERAGLLRASLRRAGRKAALGDALIAQACLDSNVALLTRDSDFKAFAELAGLKLA